MRQNDLRNEPMGERANILIVDDDVSAGRSLELILSKAGYGIERVTSGKEALEKAQVGYYNLALLDVKLPDMGGVRVLTALKRIHPDMTVIMITGYASLESSISSLNKGASAYITKPLDLDNVLAEVSRALEKQRLIMENRRLYEEVRQALAESKKTEKALRENEERFRSLVETSADFVWETDENDVYTYASPKIRDILGYEPEEVLGKTPFDLKAPEEATRVAEISRSIVASQRPFSLLENKHLHKDGHLVILESSGVPFFDSDGTFRGYRGIDRDITERKVLQSQLAQAQRLEAIGQLAAGIAHEINTPTQYVGDNVSFLKDVSQDIMKLQGEYGRLLDAARDGTITPELISEISAVAKEVDVGFLSREMPSAAEQALEGVERISNIVRAMRQFAHPGAEEKVATDVNRAIENTVMVSRNEWKYVADMETDLDPDLPFVQLLPGEFNQVILNMIVNAAHSIANVVGDGSGGKGKITIKTRRNGELAEIRVSDTGTGIPEKLRDRVFDPFFTTKEVGKGTGQGLAIAHVVIVDKHNGTIALESEEGKGASFIVRLPIGPDDCLKDQDNEGVRH